MSESSNSPSQDDPDPDPDPGPGLSDDSRWSTGGIKESRGPGPIDFGATVKREKGRVRFNSNAAAALSPPSAILSVASEKSQDRRDLSPPKVRPSALRNNSSSSITVVSNPDKHADNELEKAVSSAEAQERARQVAAKVRRDSATPESRGSFEFATHASGVNDSQTGLRDGDIPLQSMVATSTTSVASQDEPRQGLRAEAFDLVRAHAHRFGQRAAESPPTIKKNHGNNEHTGIVNDDIYDGVYDIPAPDHYRGSVLSQLLKLYKPQESSQSHHSRNSSAGGQSTAESGSGATTPTR